jgi:hypothetical protein
VPGPQQTHLRIMHLQHVFIFKKKNGTTQYTFVANEIIQYYLNNDSNVYETLLDASRAIDVVNCVE